MAKIKTPAPVTEAPTPAPEAPAVDMSILIDQLSAPLTARKEADDNSKSALLDAVIIVRDFRNDNPSVDRGDVKLAIQTAVAAMLGIKIAKVQNSKANQGDDYAYTLASSMLSVAWPKGVDEEKKVAKALKAGKGWVEVRKAASKPQSSRVTDPDAKRYTVENFAEKLQVFLTAANVDLGETMEETMVRCEDIFGVIRSAPPVPLNPA